ncbi:histone-lysine N-methyltransferase ASHH3-like isoform X2 [Tasmannia lanceolata]
MLQDLELSHPATPAEFQLPDWLKNGKPIPHTFIKRNVYLNKKFKRRIEDDGIFCSCNPSPGSSSVCDRDCHCWMLLSSCSVSCKCGDSCLNKPFQHRTVKKMKLVKTEKCGLGLVADEDIKQGEFVIEYVGEVIDDKTCEERLWGMKRRGETNFYLCEINRDMVIDATYKGNKSRFINHSCQPNTEMQKWRIDGETRIGIFATRNIKRGEDVTYDYQYVQFGADQECHCGALGCRQKLGTKPGKPKLSSSDEALKLVACEVAASSPTVKALLFGKDVEDFPTGGLDRGSSHCGSPYQRKMCFRNCIGEFVRVRCPRENRWYAGYISHFNRSSRKHTVIFTDRNKAIIDMSKAAWEFL